MSKQSKVVGCLNCGYRTTDSQEIAEWAGCPNCLKDYEEYIENKYGKIPTISEYFKETK